VLVYFKDCQLSVHTSTRVVETVRSSFLGTMRIGTVLILVASSVATASARTQSPVSPWAIRGVVSELRGGAAVAQKKTQRAPKKVQPRNANNRGKGQVSGGTATIPNEIFNLVKGIVGVGVLSLPAGIAAFGNGPSAVAPALALITVIGILSAYGFSTIGRVCAYTGATSYRDAWSKSVGEGSSWIPAWSTTLKTSMACLAFSMVLADTFCSLLGSSQRTQVLLGITTVILLPLCWMKSLSALAPFSLLGVIGMGYTGVAMAKRWSDGSYSTEGSALLESVSDNLRPAFGDDGWKSVMQPSSLILVCMLSTAYMAHFNAPKVRTIGRSCALIIMFSMLSQIVLRLALFSFTTNSRITRCLVSIKSWLRVLGSVSCSCVVLLPLAI
jgi:hypothetical protein